jgi:hypothetical protein
MREAILSRVSDDHVLPQKAVLRQPDTTQEASMSTDTDKVKFSIDHVGIDVADLPAQIDFYCRAFDLEIALEGDVPEYNFRAAMLVSPTGWHVELFKRDGAGPRPIPDNPMASTTSWA